MSFIRFIPVSEIHDALTLSIGLSGGSGTGKTYSALLIARGIAEVVTGKKGAPIGFVDTENKRALHYKDAFPEMRHFDFQAVDEKGEMLGFGPDRWIEVIDAAEAEQLPVVVVDSFSHSWGGVGGVLEMHALALDRLVAEAEKRANGRYTVERDKFSMLAWAEVKPKYRRLVDRIVRAKTNIIMCTRAKAVMQKGFGDKSTNAFKTKTRRADVPWNPETDSDLMFEMAAMVILDPSAPGCPIHQIKVADQFRSIFDARKPMSVETGRALAEWAMGQGDAQKQKEVLDAARDAARGGKASYLAFYNSETGKTNRPLLRTILTECQEIAERADREAAQADDDPFADTDPSIPDRPTQEQLDAAMAEAERAAREGMQSE